ncbi:MAG: hypothetical protein IJQ21_05810 [Lachnospiraceae bacterium]|nr:hypothetical protein [Lachnospiraceae bacterium]
MKSAKTYSDHIMRLRDAISNADSIVIGAGAGLSTAAGFIYTGARFEQHFSDFIDKYHFTDMYSGGFCPFPSKEEFWAYWSRYIFVNRYMDPPKPVYENLLRLVNGKDYFVITTNVDHCFQKAGFDKKRLFYTQGDYGLFLGVGFNTPGIIKYPFRNMTAENPEAVYACINYDEMVCPDEIKEQTIALTGDAGDIIYDLIHN